MNERFAVLRELAERAALVSNLVERQHQLDLPALASSNGKVTITDDHEPQRKEEA